MILSEWGQRFVNNSTCAHAKDLGEGVVIIYNGLSGFTRFEDGKGYQIPARRIKWAKEEPSLA